MSVQTFPRQDTPAYVSILATAVAVSLSLFQVWQPLVGFFSLGSLPFESDIGAATGNLFSHPPAWILVLGYGLPHGQLGR